MNRCKQYVLIAHVDRAFCIKSLVSVVWAADLSLSLWFVYFTVLKLPCLAFDVVRCCLPVCNPCFLLNLCWAYVFWRNWDWELFLPTKISLLLSSGCGGAAECWWPLVVEVWENRVSWGELWEADVPVGTKINLRSLLANKSSFFFLHDVLIWGVAMTCFYTS